MLTVSFTPKAGSGVLENGPAQQNCWKIQRSLGPKRAKTDIKMVGHHVLLRSERIVLLRSFKARNVLLRSFFEFLATYETQKNDAFFCVLFLRM